MNEIIVAKKQFMLITFSGMKHVISQSQEIALRGTSKGEKILVNGNQINTSDIAGIIELSEYYRQNPSERPQAPQESFSAEKLQPIVFSLMRYRRALSGLLGGLQQAVSDQGTPASQKQQLMIDRISGKLKLLEKEREDSFAPRAVGLAELFGR